MKNLKLFIRKLLCFLTFHDWVVYPVNNHTDLRRICPHCQSHERLCVGDSLAAYTQYWAKEDLPKVI